MIAEAGTSGVFEKSCVSQNHISTKGVIPPMKRFMLATLSLYLLTCPAPLLAAETGQPALTTVRQKVSEELSRVDAALKVAAQKLGASGLTGDEARSALLALCGEFAFAVDCAAVDTRGRMVTVEPPPFHHVEGADISSQTQVKKIVKTKKPVLSAVFQAVEGFDAADAEYPVFSPAGQYIGSVSLLFKTEVFFAQLLDPLLKGVPVDICVMERNGRVIYDPDAAQIGQNLFRSPIYSAYGELLKLGKRIASQRQGSGSYRYKVRNENRTARKSASWQTSSLYGTEWRIVGIHVAPAGQGKYPKTGVTR